MEPTGTHVDAIGIGDNVWVTQGKTEHMATFCGEPRKLVDNGSSDEDSDKETDNQFKGAADEIEVLIRWATTGTKNFVKASSVRPMIVGQRRRRQVVNHYQAVPSQRPGANNNNNKKKKKNNKKEETTIPKAKEESDERQTDRSFRYKLFQKYQEEKREEQDRKEREEKRKEQEQKEREEKRKELEEKRREQERKELAESRQEEERIEREEKRRERERKEREEKRQEQERKVREEKRREQEQKAQQEERKAQEEEQDRKVREEKRRERERKERKQQNDAESAAAAATAANINSNEKPKMKFKLPTKEEFKRYQERKQRKKEEKRREKESAGKKRKRQTVLEAHFSSVNENGNAASRTTPNDEEQLNNATSENSKSAALNENENAASKTISNDKGPLNNNTSENSKPAASEENENADAKTSSNDKEPLNKDSSENSKPAASTPEAVAHSPLTPKPAASAPGSEVAASALASEAVAQSTITSKPAASAPEVQSTLPSKLAASTTGALSESSSTSKPAASTSGATSEPSSTSKLAASTPGATLAAISESSSTSKPAASTPGTTSQSPSTSKQAASAHMASTSKPVARMPTPTPTPVEIAQSKSTLTATVQEANAKQGSASGSSTRSRRFSDSEVVGDESAVVEEKNRKRTVVAEKNRKRSKRRKVTNSVLEDPKHTIDRGFQWEWVRNERGKYKMAKDQSSSGRTSRIGTSRNVTKRANPSNFGKRKPKSFDEAFAIIAELKRSNKDGSCDVPSDHPLVGNFVNTLRSEYMKYRQHARRHKEDSVSSYRREHKRSPRRDMTRVDSTRIKKLEKLGFQWQLSKKTTNPLVDTDDESNDVIGASSFDKSDNDSDDDLDELRKSRARNTSLSSSSSSSSVLSSDDDEDLLNSYKDDHANDDDILIVSKLNDVSLTATTCLNRELARNRKPTLPIQLYRLLRLSAFDPKLGWQKIFRWTRDGNGFQIVDEQKFMSKIVSKSSKMNKAISFRNTLGQFNFMMVDYGDGKHGKYRVFEHKSIAEAAEEKDPSLRLFYRGATSETLWKIKTRKEECDDKRVGSEDETSRKEDRKYDALDVAKPENREKDRQRRRTSDGCLLPKNGADQLLLEDGTYDKPRGAIPNGLLWDKHRGLWAPPHLLTKGRDGKKKRLVPPRISTTATKRNEVQQQHLAPNKKKQQQTRLLGDRINNSRQPASERRTRDGCLLPRSEPFQYKDGTYKRPSGHQPRGLVWDEVRGLWVPAKNSKKRKFDASDSNQSSSSSSSEEDTMIIKASKAKLFQHSSSILRTYFQPKKKKQRHNGSAAYQSKSFQARTKKNPSGIVKHTINLTNWRKLEKLMQRSTRRQQNMAAVPPAAAMTSNAFGDDEGEVRLI